MEDIRKKLAISQENLQSVQNFFMDENNPFITDLIQVIEKYGGVEEINKKYTESRKLEHIYKELEKVKPEYIDDLEWLIKQRDNDAFISESEYRRKILGNAVDQMEFDDSFAVTLELSACQYFPFLIKGAKEMIKKKDLSNERTRRRW
jgi:DNA-binding phage protein